MFLKVDYFLSAKTLHVSYRSMEYIPVYSAQQDMYSVPQERIRFFQNWDDVSAAVDARSSTQSKCIFRQCPYFF
jgi:hypothetical protein